MVLQTDKIGIRGLPSTEAESFIGGILVDNDELIVTTDPEMPSIQRARDSYGVMSGSDAGIQEINKLVKLLQDSQTVFMYQSSAKPETYGEILTFSQHEPSKDLYEKGEILPVRFRRE